MPDRVRAAAVTLGTQSRHVGARVPQRDANLGAGGVVRREVKLWELEKRHVTREAVHFKGRCGCGQAVDGYGADGAAASGTDS